MANTNLSESTAELKPLRFFLNLDHTHPYLAERGIKPETAKRFESGYCCNSRIFAGYIAMPLFHPEEPHVRVGHIGRWPGEDFEAAGKPRYLLPEGFPKHRVLFGLKQAMESGHLHTPLIVVEGPWSVLRLHQAGYAAVAILGSSLGDGHVNLLTATARPIVLMLDGDDAGLAGARTAAAKLITRSFVRVVRLAEHEQPDTLGEERLKHYLSFLTSPATSDTDNGELR
jgi:DNA primase